MSAIDAHTHFFPPRYFDLVRADPVRLHARVVEESDGLYLETDFELLNPHMRYGPFGPQHYDIDARVAAMDSNRIRMQILSGVQSLNYFWVDVGLATTVAQEINNCIADAMARYPDRFQGFASIPMQDPVAAITEVDRAIEELGLCGVQMLSNVNGLNLDDPQFGAIFDRINELDVPIFIHPFGSLNEERLNAYFLSNVIGYPSELAVAAASLMLGGAMDRYDRLRVYLGHGGGAFLFVLGRIERAVDAVGHLMRANARPSEYLDRFFVDTLVHDDRTLKFIIERRGAGGMLFGTDWPFWMQDPSMRDRLDRVCRELGSVMPEQVLEDNAQRIFALG